MIIECLECGEKNQAIQPPRPGKNYRCGKCGAAITFLQTVDTQGGINIQTPRTPPKMNVVLLIILGFITLAVFYPIWYLIRNDWLNHLSASKKLGSGLAIFALYSFVCTVFDHVWRIAVFTDKFIGHSMSFPIIYVAIRRLISTMIRVRRSLVSSSLRMKFATRRS